jgi:hypothetical protein
MLNDLRNMSTIRREAVLNELADERHQEDEDEDEDSFLN